MTGRADVFSKKREAELYDEMRSLPIRMKDRRDLYADLEAIYDYSSELQEAMKVKRIPFFRIRLYFQMLKYKLKEFGFWEHSLREIEIQRGTLTANVFYFIRWTLFFNVVLSLIAIVGMYVPYKVVYLTWNLKAGRGACNLTLWNQSDPNRDTLNSTQLADCCFSYLEQKEKDEDNLTAGSHLHGYFKFAKLLGGHTTSFLTTPFFYGYYSTHFLEIEQDAQAYLMVLPVLYSLSVFVIIIVSFCVLVRAIGDGVAEIVRNKDGDVCIFSELVFCGFWHRAQDENEARFRRKLWLHNLRVAIKQAKAITRTVKTSSAVLTKRWICFVGCVVLIISFAAAIYFLALFSDTKKEAIESAATTSIDPGAGTKEGLILLFRSISWSLLPSFAIAAGNGVLPSIFIQVGRIENYGLETSTVFVLCRSLAVRLLSVGLAIFRVFTRDYACSSLIKNTCTLCPDDDHQDRQTCWESHLGRELYKIIFTELFIKILTTFLVDPGRKLIKRIFYKFKVMRSVGTLRFSVVRHSLDIINIQVMSWLGFYFAPAYPLAVVIYLFVIFYVKKFSALVNCSGTPEAYRVSRTTTIFLLGELVSFVIVVIFLIIVVGYLEPSKGCGPFAEHKRTWEAFEVYGEVIDSRGKISRAWWAEIVRHLLSMSVYIPLQICGIAWLIHKYYSTVANHDYYESLKDLIILENQDKQYLVNRLLRLRAEYHNINYFDPLSIYDSEQKYVESTNKRLVKQWQALAQVRTDNLGRKSSVLATDRWYRGFRASHVAGVTNKGFPTMEELQKLVRVRKEQEATKAKAKKVDETGGRGRKKKRRTPKSSKKKTSDTEDEKPYSAPPMTHLLSKKPAPKKSTKLKKTTSAPPNTKSKKSRNRKVGNMTDREASSASPPPSIPVEREHAMTSGTEFGLKRRPNKDKSQKDDHRKRKSKKSPRGSKNKRRHKKRHKIGPSVFDEEQGPGSPFKEETDEDEYKGSYLWDMEGFDLL